MPALQDRVVEVTGLRSCGALLSANPVLQVRVRVLVLAIVVVAAVLELVIAAWLHTATREHEEWSKGLVLQVQRTLLAASRNGGAGSASGGLGVEWVEIGGCGCDGVSAGGAGDGVVASIGDGGGCGGGGVGDDGDGAC